MPDVNIQLVTGIRHTIDAPSGCKVVELRRLAARELQLPQDRLRLILKGQALRDAGNVPALADSDVLLAFVAPALPTAKLSRQAPQDEDEEEIEERFRLRPNATRAEQALAHVLQQRMRLPDYALILLFSIRPATISAIVLWFALAPLAARYSLGPLYVLGTILAVILTNLGTRKEGEMSAYSIFNTGARQLPGQLNADAIDQQIRAGQM